MWTGTWTRDLLGWAEGGGRAGGGGAGGPARRVTPLPPQEHHLDPPSLLPGRAGFAALGHLHHLERGPAGPPPLPQPVGGGAAQGGVPCAPPPAPAPVPHTTGTVPEAGVLCPLPQVVAFCDVDKKKIKKGFYCYEESQVSGSPGACPSTGRPQDAIRAFCVHAAPGFLPWERPHGPGQLPGTWGSLGPRATCTHLVFLRESAHGPGCSVIHPGLVLRWLQGGGGVMDAGSCPGWPRPGHLSEHIQL